MAQSEWTDLVGSLSSGSIARGATAGISPPNGGGTHVYGWKSLQSGVEGAHALHCNQAGFAPNASGQGGSIRAGLLRKSGDPNLFSPFMFFQLQGNDVTVDEGYILGISAGDPGYISLRKGALVGGLPDETPGAQGILRRSVSSVAIGTWLHLRLDVISNPSGDVILNVFQSDVEAHGIATPVWDAIPGMDSYNDDVIGVNSGSPGLADGGYQGLGCWVSGAGTVAAWDYAEVGRTT